MNIKIERDVVIRKQLYLSVTKNQLKSSSFLNMLQIHYNFYIN